VINLMKRSDSRHTLTLALIGIVYGLIVILTHRDYGINLDEPLHVIYGKSVVDWYLSGFTDRDVFWYTNLWLYGGLYDTISHLLTGLIPYDIYHTRHLLNAATGFTGVTGVYYLARHIGPSPRAGLIAAAMLLLIPRYYGHAMFNHKDIPFAAGYVWSVYLILKSMDAFPNVHWKTALLTGTVIGATVGIRIAGAILVLYYVVAFLMFASPWSKNSPSPFNWRSARRSTTIVGGVAYLVMIVCWPWVHLNPFARPFKALTMISDFPFSITTRFEGQVYDSADIPWHYAPKWLLISLPEFLLIGVSLSLVLLVLSVFRGNITRRHLQTLFVAGVALFPVLYVVVTGAPLYNGMRHLLFVVPPLCVLSAVAVDSLLDGKDTRSRVVTGLIAASALLTLTDMVRLHPNQYVYFNRLFAGGLSSAASRYDTDYYTNSHRLGANWVSHQAEGKTDVTIHASTSEITRGTSLSRKAIPWQADYVLASIDEHVVVPGEIVHTIKAAGVTLLNIIEPDEAWRGQAVYHGPEAEFHYAGLASSHVILNDVAAARRLYQEAIHRRPERAIWHYKLGRLLMDHDLLDDAITSFQRAVAIQPTYRSYYQLASCYLSQERYEDAIKSSRQSLEIRFDSEWGYLGLGRGLVGLGNFDEAEEAFERSLTLNPGATETSQELALLYLGQERYKDAAAIIDKLEAESDSVNTYAYLKARLFYEEANTLEAIAYLRRLLEASQEAAQTDARVLLAKCLRKEGQIDQAYETIVHALEQTPDDRPALEEQLGIGTAYHLSGNAKRAERIYRACLERMPKSEQGWQNLAILMYDQNRFSDALSAFSKAASVNPSSIEAHRGVGQSAEKLAKPDEALTAYRRVVELAPDNSQVLDRIRILTTGQ
jgi:tetratricopeptide (TPR) repeat protein